MSWRVVLIFISLRLFCNLFAQDCTTLHWFSNIALCRKKCSHFQMPLTFAQDDFYHDAIFWFSRPTVRAQRVLAAVVQVVVVSHVAADPGHASGGAQGVRPAQLSFLRLTAQSPHTQVCLHHQSQQPLFHLLCSKATRQIRRVAP